MQSLSNVQSKSDDQKVLSFKGKLNNMHNYEKNSPIKGTCSSFKVFDAVILDVTTVLQCSSLLKASRESFNCFLTAVYVAL